VNGAPHFDFAGRTVLITGAGRGIGRSCALAFAEAGADVALGLRNAEGGSEIAAQIERLGRKVLPVAMDVRHVGEVRTAMANIVNRFGRIDILVNNAGLGPESPAESVTEEDFDLTLDTNIKGTFFVSQAAARFMIPQRGGVIINLSSQAGRSVLVNESVYCASKAAIDHLTRCFAREWACHGIRVNAVAPTYVWTDATQPSLTDAAYLARTLAHLPLGRIGEPREVANAVLWLASPGASLVTGSVLLADGGWSTM
jgi:NAD(P)-dependent dehydrogenase (short-subunit alcohol dehydrogenase family)